jgi:ribosomal protein L28
MFVRLQGSQLSNMSRLCDTCGRGSNRAQNRSHSNVATKREQHANLQVKRFGGMKLKVCTRCLRTMDKMVQGDAKK